MECKANKRNDALPSVQFQEASQIAAWLVQDHRPASAAIEGAWNMGSTHLNTASQAD